MVKNFVHSYIPHTDNERREMLDVVGVNQIEDLFLEIPEKYRDPNITLPSPLTEMELLQELESLSAKNVQVGKMPSFLGGGAYSHFIPSVVASLTSRGEFLTSYTPYQPEVSQGTLQATYEFQSMMCELTGMDVANAGMYDGATAFAEAALMACRLTKRYRVYVLDSISSHYLAVLRTYLLPQSVEIVIVSDYIIEIDGDAACLLVQYPNALGVIPDLASLGKLIHSVDGLFVVNVYPVALGMLKPPSEYEADIVTGECQSLGIPLSFGGPYVGMFACRNEHIRQLPGRIVGKTNESHGDRDGFVLTLQTREQHIRRENATSNICTSEALIATAVAIHLALLGPRGLRQVAQLCYNKAHYAARCISELPGYYINPHAPDKYWFNEFVVTGPKSVDVLQKNLFDQGIIGGINVTDRVKGGLLFCVTEINSKQEIDNLVIALNNMKES
jgi:glycine dehydrogenase subunit 1